MKIGGGVAEQDRFHAWHRRQVRSWWTILRYWVLASVVFATVWFGFAALFPKVSLVAVIVLVWLTLATCAATGYGVFLVVQKVDP